MTGAPVGSRTECTEKNGGNMENHHYGKINVSILPMVESYIFLERRGLLLSENIFAGGYCKDIFLALHMIAMSLIIMKQYYIFEM